MVVGNGSDALTLALWDGSTAPNRWSEPRRMSYSFEGSALGKRIYLGEMQAALVDLPSNVQGEPGGKALIVVGTDREGEVWVVGSQVGALETIFAPLLPWSEPVNFSQSQAFPGLPAVAADEEGQVHVLWSEASAPCGRDALVSPGRGVAIFQEKSGRASVGRRGRSVARRVE
jgi:hypothetical protein